MPDVVPAVPPSTLTDRRAAITGAGLATCHGVDVASTWRAILAGRDGFGPMASMESDLPPGSDGAECPPLPDAFRPDLPREARYLRWTIDAALADAGIAETLPVEPGRACVILGTTLHGMRAGGRFLRDDDPRHLDSFLAGDVLRLATDGLPLRGMAATTCSACSSSLGSVALAATLLNTGEADLVVAGGYDTISEYVWGGFNALRLVANGPPRPFCKDRPGMKLGEGYGIVVLERVADAERRGARPLAIVSGWGESSDAFHLTRPHPEGEGAARAMAAALESANLDPAQIGLAAAHATGTPDNDLAEFAALSRTFGEGLGEVPVVAFKSHLGHTLGGAGAVEMILAACALRDGVVPTTARVAPDEVEFDGLNLPTGKPRRAALRHAISTSLGFGGANTSVVLSRPDAPSAWKAHARQEVVLTGVGAIVPGAVGIDAVLDRLDNEPPAESLPLDEALLDGLIDARKTRRMSPYVKLTLAVARLALEQAGLLDDADRLASTAAILGSTHGSPGYCADYYAKIVAVGVRLANPMLFAEGVPNAASAQLSLAFGLGGACQTIIGTRTSGLDALRLAALRVREGRVDRVVVAAAEETHPSLDRAYRTFGHQRDGDAAGFVPSAGAACLIVESRRSAEVRGATVLATLGTFASFNAGADGLAESLGRLRGTLPDVPAIGSANGSTTDAAERAAFGAAPSLAHRLGELFAAGPLLGVAIVATGGAGRLASRCRVRHAAAGPADNAATHAGPGMQSMEMADDLAVVCTDRAGPVAGATLRVERSAGGEGRTQRL